MGIESVRQVLEESLSRPSVAPSFDFDRDIYLAEQRTKLRTVLIAPTAVEAVASDWARQYAQCDSQVRPYVAVARMNETWLLYSPKDQSFAKASGKTEDGPLSLLGFFSDDALAEWLG